MLGIEVPVSISETLTNGKVKINIIPSDSISVFWNGDNKSRLLVSNVLYKYCSAADTIEEHWEPECNFGKNVRGYDGLHWICKYCTKIQQRGSVERNKLKPVLLEQQNYECKMCHRDLKRWPSNLIQVDHNPKNGKVRGVLCKRCNGRLPKGADNLESQLTGAIFCETEGSMGVGLSDSEIKALAQKCYDVTFKIVYQARI